jgi:hypothetical protein
MQQRTTRVTRLRRFRARRPLLAAMTPPQLALGFEQQRHDLRERWGCVNGSLTKALYSFCGRASLDADVELKAHDSLTNRPSRYEDASTCIAAPHAHSSRYCGGHRGTAVASISHLCS